MKQINFVLSGVYDFFFVIVYYNVSDCCIMIFYYLKMISFENVNLVF